MASYRGSAAIGCPREGRLLGSFREGGGSAARMGHPRLAVLWVGLLESLHRRPAQTNCLSCLACTSCALHTPYDEHPEHPHDGNGAASAAGSQATMHADMCETKRSRKLRAPASAERLTGRRASV